MAYPQNGLSSPDLVTGELTGLPGPQNWSLPGIGVTKFQNRSVTVGRSSSVFPQLNCFSMIIRGITSLSDHSGKSAAGGMYIKGSVYVSTGPFPWRQFRLRAVDRSFPWRRFRRRAVGRSRLAHRSRVAFACFASVFLTGTQWNIFVLREHYRPHWGVRIFRIIQKCNFKVMW